MARIDQRAALDVLAKPRLLEIAAAFDLDGAASLGKPELVEAIAGSQRAPFPHILELLKRNELKAICQAAGIDDSGREKARIAGRILGRSQMGATETVTKAALVEDVAAATGLLKQDAEVMVNVALEAMVQSLRAGSSIEIRGFGSFRLRELAARIGRNPRTGARVEVAAKRVCYFKPGRKLKELLNP